jgi:DNA invertase Pin-like site-specific DNA recombinase
MNPGDGQRIAKRHLERNAIVYVRQSDSYQVRENAESTLLQRSLREKAIEMGWAMPRLVEDDLGITASGFADRPGFRWMLEQVTQRKVGIIFCIEASRLSRNSSDWAQLFELCGYFDTLVADTQQVYDVSIPNDRLVLQIRGTVAEVELSSLRIRLRAGIEAKAARGELKILLPPGYVYDANDQIAIDPDERVQQAIRSMFEQFAHATSVRQLALAYRDTQTLFPIRKPRQRDRLQWGLPNRAMLHKLLSHPIYAGVYARGRTRSYVDFAEGKLVKRTKRILSPDEWRVCIRDHHEAYISWQQYQDNQGKLAEARPRWTMDENRCAVREGRALLAGLVRCGQCGRKLRVIYNRKSSAMYFCDGAGPRGARTCLSFGAKYVDREVGDELCRAMEPLAIEAAKRAFELEREERDQAVEHARLRIEAAQYAADRAFEQYDLADPKNRLVVDNLEKRLNAKLVEVRLAQDALERRLDRDPPLTKKQCEELCRLSLEFPRLWNHPDTPTTLRKQLLRAAIREVIVKREGSKLAFTIHWAGDTCTQLAVNKRATPVGSKTDASLTELVQKLAAASLDDAEIARILNMKKTTTPRDLRWTKDRVKSFRSRNRIRTGPKPDPSDVLTGQQARDYLGVGYHGLTALVARGAIHTNQVTDFAPWRISRAELDSDYVQYLVAVLKRTGKLPPEEGSPQLQAELFTEKSTETRKGAL